MHKLNATNGIITVVQEHRFQLRQDNGQDRLFILPGDAPQGWTELQALKDREQPVTVYFSESENKVAATAHDVWQR